MNRLHIFLTVMLALVLASCEYDNYDGPQYYFTGNVTYEGKAFVADGNANILKACQKGFGKTDGGQKIRISEDGTFSQLFFGGDFYMTLYNQRFPFQFVDFPSLGLGLGYDTIPMTIKKNEQRDFEVIPYFVFDTVYYVQPDENSTTLDVKIRFHRNPDSRLPEDVSYVQRAFLFVGTTPHVNSATVLSKGSRPMKIYDESGEVTIKIELNKYRSATYYPNNYRDYLYFRIGLNLKDIDACYLFSDLYKVENVPYVQ